MGLITPAWTDNSTITRWRYAHQSWVRVAPPSDDINVTTRANAAYGVLCDTAIIVTTSWAATRGSLSWIKAGIRVAI